ncbi:MAG: hypothetical protein RL161_1318 [Bacteroidota bacterium]|jgi:nucleotide-binding universal stress UspA family protein
MRLLIPADFSEISKKAALYGADLAKKFGAELTLIHVHKPMVSRNNPSYNLEAEMAFDAQRSSGIQMGEYYSELFSNSLTNCSGVTRVGKPADEIVLEASRDENSIIVMGTHQNGGLKRWMNGSRTAEVIEKTDHPVLVVPFGVNLKSPEKIVFITGGDSYDFVAIEKLSKLSGALNASLYLVHITSKKEKSKNTAFVDFCKMVKLQVAYSKIYSQMVLDSSVINGITKYLESHQPDLLSFNVSKNVLNRRMFKKTFVEKISSLTNLPMLIFHRP